MLKFLRLENEWGHSNMMQCLRKMELIEYGKIGLKLNMAFILASGIKIQIREMGGESLYTLVEV